MTKHPCPTCKQPTAWEENPWRPFCSERCKLIDLGLWATEHYRVPGEPAPIPDQPHGESESRPDEKDKK